MEYTDKAKQIVHEAEITRQHARYKIPAQIEIEGKRYKVYDWSVSGVGIIGLPDEIYQKKHAVARMIFKFDDFETVIDNLHLEFVSKRPDGVVGARFTELTPQQIAILNQIISAYLAGDIVTEDDIIHAVTRANFVQKKEAKTKVDKKKSIMVLLLLWSFVIFLLMFLLYVMYQRIYIIRSENAFFDANMTVIRAPSPSYIEFAKAFKEGDEVNKSETLMFAHIMYGGVKIVKSPIDGYMYKIMIHNGDFRNVGEPVFAILEKNYQVFIIANVLHKDLVKIKLGDIARVELPNGDRFYARVAKIDFPYNVVEQHSKPLENIYNQARNYDKVLLMPINYNPPKDLISTSAVVTIDTFLNKHKWYSISPTKPVVHEKNNTKKRVCVVENNVSKKTNPSENNTTAADNNAEIKTSNITATQNTAGSNLSKPLLPKEPKKVKYVKKYCIIAASSTREFKDLKAKEFLSAFSNAWVEKVGNIYELKVGPFDSLKKAKMFLKKEVKKYYKDAFIIKCKVKEND